jgi:hypothetical protein
VAAAGAQEESKIKRNRIRIIERMSWLVRLDIKRGLIWVLNYCFSVVSQATPAIAAGLTKRFMSIEDIARMAEPEVPKKRGTYKKREVPTSVE